MKFLIVGMIVVGMRQAAIELVAADGLRVTTFSADITTPLGQPIGLGFIPVLSISPWQLGFWRIAVSGRHRI